MRLVLAAVTAAALAAPALAADKNGAFHVVGEPGAQKCSAFVAKLNDADAMLTFGHWYAGYITAANRLTPETYNRRPII
jgi:opacity protein-like surface antigen